MTHLRSLRSRRGVALPAIVMLLTCLGASLPALAAETLRGTININTATADQLELLPGIGASRAQAVIEARKRVGGFEQVDDLLAVKGIGEASLEKLKPFITLDGKTTAKLE